MRRCLVMVLFVATVMGISLLSLAQEPAQTILKNAPTVDEYPGMEGVYMLDGAESTYLANGTRIDVTSRCLCLLTQEGVKDHGEVQIPYDTDLQEIHLDYARTITPNGKVVVPDKSAIHEVTPPILEGAPMYSSIKLYTISMPALEPGAIIDYQVTVKDKEPPLPEEGSFFSTTWYFAGDLPIQRSHYVVHAPNGTHLDWQVKGINLTPTIQTDSNTITYTFLKNDIPAIGYEVYMPDLAALSPVAAVTTFSSWDKIASWYNDLCADRIQTDSNIVAKVQELTTGIKTPSEKISAIYDFVASKIRYVALEFGIGGYQPHPAAKTFTNRYGDCKDQATLLITMLRQAGLDAYPVLLKVGNGVDVDFSLPPTIQTFNHVIVAVRQDNNWVFLDPTLDIGTSSYLPEQDQNHHCLLILGKNNQPGLIVSTDPYAPEKTYVKSDVHATLSPEGNLTASATITTGGNYNIFYRFLLLSRRPNEREKLFGQILNAVVPGARLSTFEYSDLNDTHTPVMLTEKFSKNQFAQSAAGMLLFATPYPAQFPYPGYFAQGVGQDTRTYPMMSLPKLIEEHFTIGIPENMNVQLPDDKHVTNKLGSFDVHYEYTAGEITVIRTLKVIPDEIPPNEYPLVKKIIQAMLEDANAMIVLKPAG